MPRPWIVRHRAHPEATTRLYCFPYAGSGASAYRIWPTVLPPTIEVCAVQLPGRESRFREAPFADLPLLVQAFTEAMLPTLRPPFVLFGHSYGAWAAFELARHLQEQGAPSPAHLFVSGRRAPGLPDRLPLLHQLSDRDFQSQLEHRYGGIPAEISRDEELMRLLLPALRADLTAVETYAPPPGPRLACPVSVFGGMEDESTTLPELEAWRAVTTGPFQLDTLPGGHFFLGTARDRLLTLIASRL